MAGVLLDARLALPLVAIADHDAGAAGTSRIFTVGLRGGVQGAANGRRVRPAEMVCNGMTQFGLCGLNV